MYLAEIAPVAEELRGHFVSLKADGRAVRVRQHMQGLRRLLRLIAKDLADDEQGPVILRVREDANTRRQHLAGLRRLQHRLIGLVRAERRPGQARILIDQETSDRLGHKDTPP
jgi:hypothetical protein